MHIALVEDDSDQLALLKLMIGSDNHTTRGFDSVSSVVEALKSNKFDLLLVDWMLPDGSGADLLKWARQNLGWELPIIVVTARDDETTVCAALKCGADDYIVKPAKHMELLARIEAIARRARPGTIPVLRMGAYEVDIQSQTMLVEGQPVAMTQKEFDLSVCLFQSPGKLLSRDHLLNKVWGLNTDVDTRTVDTHVSRLRKKLKLDGLLGWKLVPVYGYGYRFDRVEVQTKDSKVSVMAA